MLDRTAWSGNALCARPRVADRVRSASRCRIAFVHGPAGCGKSVALAQHVAGLSTPRVLYAVRYEALGVAAFARALMQQLAPVSATPLRVLPAIYSNVRRRAHPWDAVATLLAARIDTPVTIAVDQLHRLPEDGESFRFLVRLVDESANHVRWMLAARSSVSLPLPRWLAAGAADASCDESMLRLDASEVPPLSAAMHCDATAAYALRERHDGRIGAVVAEVCGTDRAWLGFEHRATELVALAALPSLDDDLVARLPRDTAALLEHLQATVPLAVVARTFGAPRTLTESARERIRAIVDCDHRTIASGQTLAARALEGTGNIGGSLQAYIAAGAEDDILRMLDVHGFELQERDGADMVAAALAALSPQARRRSTLALMLEGLDESYRGRYDVSEAWFEQALGLANSDEQRLRVDIAYAVDLLRRGRADAFDRLEALAGTKTDSRHAVTILASLAVAHASAERLDDARECITRALADLPGVDDPAISAMVHQRAAFVALCSGDAEAAERRADVAAALALEQGNDELVAISRSVSYVVAASFLDDQDRALQALDQIAKAAGRLDGGLFRRFAILGEYLIYAERGNGDALHALDRRLAGEELEASSQHIEDALLPARALRDGWSGKFALAYRTLASSAERQPSPETRALRWAEISMYAAAADLRSEAAAAVAHTRVELQANLGAESLESIRARLLLSLTSLLLGRRQAARTLLCAVSSELARWPRWQALHGLLQAMLGARRAGNSEGLLVHFEALRNAGLGGYAAMIETLPSTHLAFSRRTA